MLTEYIGVAQLKDLVDQHARLVEEVPVSEFTRLRQATLPHPAVAEPQFAVVLEFSREPEQQEPGLTVKIDGEIAVECQRCLEPLVLPVSVEQSCMLLNSGRKPDDEQQLFDVVQVGERGLAIKDLIEDEVLSAIPLAPRHEDCVAPDLPDGKPDATDDADGVHKPFEGLADLLKKDS